MDKSLPRWASFSAVAVCILNIAAAYATLSHDAIMSSAKMERIFGGTDGGPGCIYNTETQWCVPYCQSAQPPDCASSCGSDCTQNRNYHNLITGAAFKGATKAISCGDVVLGADCLYDAVAQICDCQGGYDNGISCGTFYQTQLADVCN